ncbi:MAG TPA: hypothetical protein VJS39_05280 [Gemmatimonadaceae bacterium]|nr:hypothetical protein [Gemmatimonadaceae bacterium]
MRRVRSGFFFRGVDDAREEKREEGGGKREAGSADAMQDGHGESETM